MKRINTKHMKDVTNGEWSVTYHGKNRRKESSYFQAFIIGVVSSFKVSTYGYSIGKEIAISIILGIILFAIWYIAKKLLNLK